MKKLFRIISGLPIRNSTGCNYFYFSQECMAYHREYSQVEYQSKDGSQTKVFDALEWMATMCSHVPGKGE